ncbi:MAG TPA: TlpA disulfide reductase family protein [Saprospiraceae bacterium]|nr:TlpA disulfide reductase family protein [Saprospiraceae bacterium]
MKAQENVVVFAKYDDMSPQFLKNNDTLYVVNFWATWCKPCVAELPFFLEAEQFYKSEKVKFLLVSLDFSDQLEKRVLPFIAKNNIKSTCFLLADQDANGWIPKVDADWSGAIPASAIFKNGKKVHFTEGNFESTTDLKKLINNHL